MCVDLENLEDVGSQERARKGDLRGVFIVDERNEASGWMLRGRFLGFIHQTSNYFPIFTGLWHIVFHLSSARFRFPYFTQKFHLTVMTFKNFTTQLYANNRNLMTFSFTNGWTRASENGGLRLIRHRSYGIIERWGFIIISFPRPSQKSTLSRYII